MEEVLQEQASGVFDAVRGPKPADPAASSERLYSEIGRLKMEMDWLKKNPGSAYRELRGLNIDQAVAITFTDKAAAEIKERVIHDLPDAMLKKIIRGRQDRRISTIHSFCMNLLKRYPLEAGLPPDFGVLDARDQVYNIRKSIEDSLEEADRDPVIMAPLSHVGRGEQRETRHNCNNDGR